MTLRLSDEQTEALRETAEREGRSMQDVARAAIEEYVSRRARLRDEILDRVMERDAGLLERLAKS